MKEILGGDYESCKNMIWKLALDRFNKNKKRRPDVEFDDVLGEAMCIYSQCLENFNGNKGMKFTTYLYQNLLGRLADFYDFSMREMSHYEDMNFTDDSGKDKRYEDNIVSCNYDVSESTKELIQIAKEELSYEGFQVFKYIISREWENSRQKCYPRNSYICKRFGYSPEITQSIMSEISHFWNKIGWQVA